MSLVPQSACAQEGAAATDDVWTAWGGALGFQWNVELLSDLGMGLAGADGADPQDAQGFVPVPLREQGGLSFAVVRKNFHHFTGGSLGLRGGFRLRLPDGGISLVDAALRPRAGDPLTLDLVGADGKVWFYLDKLMYRIGDDGRVLDVQTMDLRVHPDLAFRLGKPQAADWAIAQLRMTLGVLARDGKYIEVTRGTPVWPGTAVPGVEGQTFQADVFMRSFTAQYSRCGTTVGCESSSCACDGPGGATNGYAVFTPSSELRNNVNNGTAQPTVSGDPNGTSKALYTADVAWYRKFAGTRPPYDNDQHPNLIWNLYRIDPAGRIEQIGRSGVKHAFLTTNTACATDGPGSLGSTSEILGRSCSDIYGTGNNDDENYLAPRSEILPVKDMWARCGSFFDKNCDRSSDSVPSDNWRDRMIVRESQLDTTNTTTSNHYVFESWYIVRDDVNIYNTMGSKPVTFRYANGGPWSIQNGTPYRIGPAIDRWVEPAGTSPTEKNTAITNSEGNTKVAVKATDLGNGRWRYDYAVMNFDFARAATTGTPGYTDDTDAAQRFRIVHNMGYDRFSVPVPFDAELSAIEFADGDLDASNDWTAAEDVGALTWTAPANSSPTAGIPPVLNTLNWGTLFRFSFESAKAPAELDVNLHVAQSGTPESYAVTVLGPTPPEPDVDAIFADNFDDETP